MSHNIGPYTGASPEVFRDVDPALASPNNGKQPVLAIADSAGNLIGSATTTPSTSDRGLVVRQAGPLPAGTNDIGNIRIAGGSGPANESGNLTAAQPLPGTVVAGGTVGGSTDYTSVGNVTVAVFGTGHAGFTVIAEASPDGGTNWFTLSGQNELTNVAEATVAVPTNSSRVWSYSLFGFNRFRIRATTRTSGTLSVILSPGTILIEPVVSAILSKPPTQVRTSLTTATAGVAGATSEALMTLVPVRDGAAGGTSTTFTPTTGKTFKIQNLIVTVVSGAASVQSARFYLRGVATGTASVTSPIMAMAGANTIAAVSGAQNTATVPLDMDIPSGWSIGLTFVAAVASGSMHVAIQGYEY